MRGSIAKIYDSVILKRPKIILCVLLSVLIFFSYHTKDFRLDASADSLLLEDDADLDVFRKIHARYPSQDLLIVTYSPKKDLFSDDSLAVIRKLRRELKGLDGVESVFTILDAPLIKSSDLPLAEMVNDIPSLESSHIDRTKAKQELLNSPIYKELIISPDGQTTALLLSVVEDKKYKTLLDLRNQLRKKKRNEGLSNDENIKLEKIKQDYDVAHEALNLRRHYDVINARKILQRYQETGVLYLGGLPMITDDMVTFVRNDLAVFGGGVLVFLILVLATIFREIRWITLPLLSCFYSGTIMIGLLGLIGWNVTVISSNFLALMLIITISMNIHLIVRYRQLDRDYPELSQEELVRSTIHKMVKPCFYTALTTIMGFSSLIVSDIKPVIDFGWMMSAGLAVTFATSFLLFPTLLILRGKIARTPLLNEIKFVLPSLLARLSVNQGNKILFLSILLVALSGVGISQLRVENSFINYFSQDTEIFKGLKFIDEKLGGTSPLEIVIKFDNVNSEVLTPEDLEGMTKEEIEMEREYAEEMANSPEYWFTPDKVQRIKKIHDYLDSLENIGKVLSLASAIRVAEDYAESELDGVQLALLYSKLPPVVKRNLIDPYISIQDNEARILARVRDSKPDLRRKQLLQTINQDLVGKLNLEKKNFTVSGLLVLYNNMLQSLFKSQIKTIGVVMFGIGLMFLLLFRSLTLSIIGILPNLLGAAVVLGGMGWFNIPMDMMTITIAAITVGIAVDNGIHYIYRFREEYAVNKSYEETVYICHSNIGKAVFYTTMTIIFGFSILVFSNFIPTIYFGILTATAMFIGLLAALTVLPKLIIAWKPFN